MQLYILLAAAAKLAVAASSSQCFSYSEITVTDCGPTQTTKAAASRTEKSTPGIITVTMPVCDKCNHCDSCVYTHIYTTAYEYICPTGVATTTYTVCEKYPGMTAKPTMATPTGCPYGFTTTVEECTVCGPKTVTKTLTVPVSPVPTKDHHGGGGGRGGSDETVPLTGGGPASAVVSLYAALMALAPVMFVLL